jgi:hypothetical protein
MRPAVHHHDPVGHRQSLFLVMRDDERRDAIALKLDALDLDLHVEAEVLVERRERFVEEQDRRAHGERPGQRNPLLLAARHLPRVAPGEVLQPHQRQHLGDPRLLLGPTDAPRREAVGDVVGDAHVGEQGVVLEHDADGAPVRRQVVDRLTADDDARPPWASGSPPPPAAGWSCRSPRARAGRSSHRHRCAA